MSSDRTLSKLGVFQVKMKNQGLELDKFSKLCPVAS
jgi:hypothetical protein